MTMANPQIQAQQLAEQINDEFLTCKICFEHYKDPKCLTCLHTFCEECIEQHVNAQRSYKYTDYREFSCPICRKKTVIPSGGVRKLNDNFLISSLNELLVSKKTSKIAYCDICKTVYQREREATSKCVECQKSMCRTCVQAHQQMKISMNHSVFELEIEKDVMCKVHASEQVRFYCEPCEVCVCVACTYTDHRDHDLVDFKEGITHHKDAIEDNLRRCRQKMVEIRNRLDLLRHCETKILCTQNDIHAAALTFIEDIRKRETSLIDELNEMYGSETNDYLKKKDELQTFLDQLKSTCNLTEMVVKGKDIELLLLKKQLCEKFEEFQDIHVDAVPRNILKKVDFKIGELKYGELECTDEPSSNQIAEVNNLNKTRLAAWIRPRHSFEEDTTNGENEEEEEAVSNVESEDVNGHEEEKDDVSEVSLNQIPAAALTSPSTANKTTQIAYRDFREILGDGITESEVQTDIRMIHELQAPSKYESFKLQQAAAVKMARFETREVQTDQTGPMHAPLSTQSSVEEEPNAPIDRNKLGKRVRRHVKPGCSIAVLPSSEIIIVDPEANVLTVLDRRGKFRFGMSNGNKPCTETGHSPQATQPPTSLFAHLAKLERGIRIATPQGNLIIKLENEAAPPPQAVDTNGGEEVSTGVNE